MKHELHFTLDDDTLGTCTDQFVAFFWHAAQHNAAPFGDQAAGELTERVGREIIRRWLQAQAPALWNHQGSHFFQRLVMEHVGGRAP